MTLLLLLTGYPQGAQGVPEAGISGQPAMVRSQFVPFMPGYGDRIGKWNMVISDKVRKMLEEMKLRGGYGLGRLART